MPAQLREEQPCFNALQSILKDLQQENDKLAREVQGSKLYLKNNQSSNNFEKILQDHKNILNRERVITQILRQLYKSVGVTNNTLPSFSESQTGNKARPYTIEEFLKERASHEKTAKQMLEDFSSELENLLSPPSESNQEKIDPNNEIKTYIVHDSWLPVFVQQILNTAKEALGVKNSSQKLMENIQDISERYKTWKKDGTTNNEAATNKEEANTRLGM